MPRASRQEIIEQITKDWNEASENLSGQSTEGNGIPTAPSKHAAFAYLAKLNWLLGSHAWAYEQGDEWATSVLKIDWPEMESSQSYFAEAKK